MNYIKHTDHVFHGKQRKRQWFKKSFLMNDW